MPPSPPLVVPSRSFLDGRPTPWPLVVPWHRDAVIPTWPVGGTAGPDGQVARDGPKNLKGALQSESDLGLSFVPEFFPRPLLSPHTLSLGLPRPPFVAPRRFTAPV